MILGMSTFVFVHVVLSLVGIITGLIVMFGLLGGKRLDGWTGIFLLTTVATSVTGFLLPAHHFMPSHGVGIVSMVVLVLAILARYAFHLAGGWRRTYVVSAMIALYLNVFVLIAQAFQKVPSLKAMAPMGSEPAFLVAGGLPDDLHRVHDRRGDQVSDRSGWHCLEVRASSARFHKRSVVRLNQRGQTPAVKERMV